MFTKNYLNWTVFDEVIAGIVTAAEGSYFLKHNVSNYIVPQYAIRMPLYYNYKNC